MTANINRRIDIDCAKGLGIFLVVLGHLVAKNQPLGNAWFALLQTGIYTFHMPFFVFLSGYVAFMSGAGDTPPRGWVKLFRRRAERLLLPFVLFGMLLFVGKLLAARFMYVDNPPQLTWESVLNLVWNTNNSPAISIWYMYMVFLSTVVTPVLIWLARGSRLLALTAGAVLFVVGLPQQLFMDRFAEFYFFFVLGALAADAGEKWLSFLDQYRWVALSAFVGTMLVLFSLPSFSPHWSHLVCGVLSLAALHSLVRWKPLANSNFLLLLGSYSFVIYLLNTPAIGLAKGILIKWVPWDGPTFVIHAVVLLISGIVVPVLIKRWIFKRWRYLDRLTD